MTELVTGHFTVMTDLYSKDARSWRRSSTSFQAIAPLSPFYIALFHLSQLKMSKSGARPAKAQAAKTASPAQLACCMVKELARTWASTSSFPLNRSYGTCSCILWSTVLLTVSKGLRSMVYSAVTVR